MINGCGRFLRHHGSRSHRFPPPRVLETGLYSTHRLAAKYHCSARNGTALRADGLNPCRRKPPGYLRSSGITNFNAVCVAENPTTFTSFSLASRPALITSVSLISFFPFG